MKTLRQELIDYRGQLKRLDWLQTQLYNLNAELNNHAEIICTHADATKERTLLIKEESENEREQGLEAFTVFVLHPDNWSRNYTQNLRLEPVIELKSHPNVDGSLEETT